MDEKEILLKLNGLFRDVFGKTDLVVDEQTTPDMVDEWDSLNHAQLIAAIESGFQIKFKLTEMLDFKSVGRICLAVQKKLETE